MSWDTVVVGAGVAGLTAGLRLAQAGQRVAVIAKGVGGTHLAPGTIDVLGYDPERVERPGEAVQALVAERPDHPYAQIGADTIPRALEWFTGQMAEGPLGPYTYLGGTEANLMLPTAVGAVKPSALVPETMAGGEVRHGGRVCVVGFRKLKDFHAALLADNLNRAGMGIEARAVELDLPSSGPADLNALALARQFDKPAFRAEVAGQLVARLRADERLAFPAVLGVADPHAAWTDLQRQLAHPVFEVPTLPPSVSGMRVFATLRGLFGLAGGRFFGNRPVVGAQLEGGRVTAVLARGASRDEPFAGRPRRARLRRLRLRRPLARLRVDDARQLPRPAGRRRARAATSRASAPATSTSTRWRAPASPSTTSCARSSRAAAGPPRTCWWRARPSPARCRGGRSPATASA